MEYLHLCLTIAYIFTHVLICTLHKHRIRKKGILPSSLSHICTCEVLNKVAFFLWSSIKDLVLVNFSTDKLQITIIQFNQCKVVIIICCIMISSHQIKWMTFPLKFCLVWELQCRFCGVKFLSVCSIIFSSACFIVHMCACMFIYMHSLVVYIYIHIHKDLAMSYAKKSHFCYPSNDFFLCLM